MPTLLSFVSSVVVRGFYRLKRTSFLVPATTTEMGLFPLCPSWNDEQSFFYDNDVSLCAQDLFLSLLTSLVMILLASFFSLYSIWKWRFVFDRPSLSVHYDALLTRADGLASEPPSNLFEANEQTQTGESHRSTEVTGGYCLKVEVLRVLGVLGGWIVVVGE